MVAPSHLKSFQALELAVRTGSFAAAAEQLAITPAAVGQRVKVLEDYLGIVLLDRGRAGISPTPELTRALPHLAAAFAEIEAASAAFDMQRPQEVHIAAMPDFAELWLKSRLAGFRAAHPHVRLCLNGEGDTQMRLARVDCEIVFGAPAEDAQTDLLFRDFVLPIASPAIARRTGAIDPAACLEGFPLLHLDFYRDDPDPPSWKSWCAANAVARTAPDRGMRFQRIAGALDAVLADAGVVLSGVALLTEAVDNGRVALPFPSTTGRATRHAFLARYRTAGPPSRSIALFRTWLREQAGHTAQWLAGFGDPATGAA